MKSKQVKTIQKITIIIICIVSFNFIAPMSVSHADIGGVLFSPTKAIVSTLADGIMDLIDFGITGTFKHVIVSDALEFDGGDKFTGDEDELSLPWFKVTPEKIFSNQIELLNIDFINEINQDDYSVNNDSTTKNLKKLRKVIASWYLAIRNLALVAMLSILVYVGIRIIISSSAADKAKYKQMILDWVIGICLIFMLHYIMSFTMLMVEKVTELINSTNDSAATLQDMDGNIKLLKDYKWKNGDKTEGGKGEEISTLPDLMSYTRFYVQLNDFWPSLTYLIIYIALIAYTLRFVVIYLKRVLTVAFLTIIAPFVAMTYPIDKMNDGKAQAFNMWFKEYLFNALIQPFHLILYTILIGTAVELATDNLLYAVVAIGFLIPAEKLLKKMFGFDKATTPPGLGGALAAGAGAQAMKNMLSKAGGKSKGNIPSGSGGNGGNEGTSNNPRARLNYGFDEFTNNGESEGEQNQKPIDSENSNPALPGSENNNSDLPGSEDNKPTSRVPENDNPTLPNSEDNKPTSRVPENDNPALPNSENNKPKPNKKPKGTARKMAGLAGRKAINSAKRTIKNPRTYINAAKGIAKTATKLGGAIGGAAIGLGIGATTGDLSTAMSLAAIGAGTGSKLGENAFNAASEAASGIKDDLSNLKMEATSNSFDEYQEKRKEKQAQVQAKNFKNDKSNQKFFEDNTGASGKELNEIMDSAAYYDQYQDFEDNEEKLKAIELENYYKDQGVDKDMARTLVKASASMANSKDYKRDDYNKKSIYMDEINNKGGQSIDKKSKGVMAQQLMDGTKYMRNMTNHPGKKRKK